jgi:hypothetical protein
MYIARVLRKLFIILCLVAQPALVLAQFESGTVLGTIRDASGGTVPNASVTLENVKTGVSFQTKTDDSGNYQFVNERLGTYRLRVEAQGFQTSTASDFEVSVNARQRVDLTLQVGATSQNVTVTTAAALLETDSSSRGQVINPRQIVDLPLNGRAYADLMLLAPGVAKSPLETQSDSSRDASYNVNGLRSELNNFMLDGIDNNAYGTSNQGFSNQVIQPNPDALAEFRVETNNYSAEYGRSAGSVINATIKSGTNQFHGELWEFNRNTIFNANGFFKPATGQKIPFNQNQFGGAFGGPIKKDKAFFFADYEGFRRVAHPVQFATVPTAAQKAGILGVSIRNPLTDARYPNGVVPASAITPFAQAVLAALPDPNLPTPSGVAGSNNFVSSPAATIYNDKGDVRYDEYFGQKVSLFGRYSQANTRIFSPASIPGAAGGNANGNVYARNYEAVVGSTWTMSPNSVLEGRLGFTYTEGGKNPIGLGNTVAGFQVPNLPTDPSFAGGLYSLNLGGGFSQLGRQNSNPQYQYPIVLDPKVNYTRILGRHSLKLGFEYQMIDTAIVDFHPKFGVDNYTGYYSNPNYPTISGSYLQQIYSLADFMFGARNHYEQNNNPLVHLRQRMYFGYLQDDFKVSQKLTLNLGVRYEFATPQWERDNHLANFNPQTGSMIFASNGSIYNRALVHPDTNNWAPRVGLAYNITPKTVIRSAYGLSYVQFNRLGGENMLAYNGPFVVDAVVDGQSPYTPTAPYTIQNICTSVAAAPNTCFRPTSLGFPNNFANPSAFNTATTQVRYIPADNPTGYVQSWHFTIQQELAKNLLLDVAYVGNHSVGLMILGDANQARPNAVGQNLSVNARRPYQSFTTIEEAFSGGFGTYHALQVKLEKRYNRGFYFLNSFTWSKAIDNAPGHLESYSGDNSRINILNPRSERGISSYDQPFNDTLSILYDLPFGKGRTFDINNKALDLIAGGWSINVINTATSGLPVNIIYSPTAQFSVSPLVTPRPNLVSGQVVTPEGQRTVNNYLNPAAFSIPTNPAQPFGNAGRNIARGYPFHELDFGLHKNFSLGSESRFVQFRAEAFNLLNKTNFGVPGSTLGSSSFGVISSTQPARQLQLALKLYF